MGTINKMKSGDALDIILHGGEKCPCNPEVVTTRIRNSHRQGYKFKKEVLHNPLPKKD